MNIIINDLLRTIPEGVLMMIAGFIVCLAVLWLMLPLAVFGIKNRLDSLINLQTIMLESINDLRRIAKTISVEPTPQQTPNDPK